MLDHDWWNGATLVNACDLISCCFVGGISSALSGSRSHGERAYKMPDQLFVVEQVLIETTSRHIDSHVVSQVVDQYLAIRIRILTSEYNPVRLTRSVSQTCILSVDTTR